MSEAAGFSVLNFFFGVGNRKANMPVMGENEFVRKYFNVFNGVIDKYSDSAHFIYEMLQNADDAGATEVDLAVQYIAECRRCGRVHA